MIENFFALARELHKLEVSMLKIVLLCILCFLLSCNHESATFSANNITNQKSKQDCQWNLYFPKTTIEFDEEFTIGLEAIYPTEYIMKFHQLTKVHGMTIVQFKNEEEKEINGLCHKRFSYTLEPIKSGNHILQPLIVEYIPKESIISSKDSATESITNDSNSKESAKNAQKSITNDSNDPAIQENKLQKITLQTDEIELEILPLPKEKAEKLDIQDDMKIHHLGNWRIWLISIGIAIYCISMVILWGLKKRRMKQEKEEVRIPAHIIALQALADLLSSDLFLQGEIKLFYQKISDILRVYIENRFGLQAPERTTEEFLQELQSNKVLPEEYNSILKAFLNHCDLVKFAKLTPKKESTLKIIKITQNFITETMEKNTENTENQLLATINKLQLRYYQ